MGPPVPPAPITKYFNSFSIFLFLLYDSLLLQFVSLFFLCPNFPSQEMLTFLQTLFHKLILATKVCADFSSKATVPSVYKVPLVR